MYSRKRRILSLHAAGELLVCKSCPTKSSVSFTLPNARMAKTSGMPSMVAAYDDVTFGGFGFFKSRCFRDVGGGVLGDLSYLRNQFPAQMIGTFETIMALL
jgi:hypothetical protein